MALVMDGPGQARAGEYTGGNLVPGTAYENLAVDGVTMTGDVGFTGPGQASITTKFGINLDDAKLVIGENNTLDVKNTSVSGSKIRLDGDVGSVLEVNAGSGSADSAVLNVYASYNGFDFAGGQINIIKGVVNAIPYPGKDYTILSLRHDAIMDIGPEGLVTTYTMATGDGAHLIADSSLKASLVQVSMNSVFTEKGLITVDGIGDTTTTRRAITTYPGNEYYPGGIYEGDVIVNTAPNSVQAGKVMLGGLHRGNITLIKGDVEFWRGGKLDGDLTLAGGTMELLLPRQETFNIPASVTGDTKISGGVFTVDEALTLEAQKGITVSGGELDASLGTLKIAAGQNLAVTGGNASLSGTDALGTGKIEGGVTVSGGELAFAGTAALTEANLTSTGSSADGKLDLSGTGTISARELTYTDATDAALTLAPGATLKAESMTFTGNAGKDFTFDGGTLVSTGSLTVADGSGTLTLGGNAGNHAALTLNAPGAGEVRTAVNVANGGTMKVEGGEWTAAAIAVDSGASLLIGTADGAASKLTVTGALSSAAAGDGAQGINIFGNAVLSADNSVLFDANNALHSGLSQIYLANGAVLEISGLPGTMSVADMAARNAALLAVGSAGLIEYANTDITFGDVPGIADGVWGSEAEATGGSLLAGKTVVYDAGNANTVASSGKFGADTLTIINAAAGGIADLGVAGNLTLLGDGANILAARDAGGLAVDVAQITVAAGQSLNLGSIGVDATTQGGRLNSAVVLNSASALNAVAGNYETGAVNGNATGEGSVSGANGGTLVVASIGATNGVAEVKAENGGTVAAQGGITTITLAVQNGTVRAQTLRAENVTVDGGRLDLSGEGAAQSTAGSVTLNNGARADIGSLKLGGALPSVSGKLTVGAESDATGGSSLRAAHVDLNGGLLLVDPAWGLASSNVAIENLSASPTATDIVAVNGSLGAGMNSYVAVGTQDPDWLPGVATAATGRSLARDNVESVLGLYKPVTIAGGQAVRVDGTQNTTQLESALTSAPDSAAFANHSLLAVNGANGQIRQGTPVIAFAGSGTVEVKNGAQLYIVDATDGAAYNIADSINYEGGSYAAATGWKGENLLSSSRMVSLASVDGKTFNATRNSARSAFPRLSDGMICAVDTLYTGINGTDLADVTSAAPGVRFLSRATDNRYLGGDSGRAADAIESAARMAFAGATPQMALLAAESAAHAVTGRLSLSGAATGASGAPRAVDYNGLALWAMPLWRNGSGRSMDAGALNYGFNGNLGGLALGADYTFADRLRAGVAVNAGGGRAESRGDFSSTTNDVNFWGVGAYLGWTSGNFALLADTAYTGTENELSQDLDRVMGMGNLSADIDAGVWQAGLRAEYRVETSILDIVPYAEARYMNLRTRSYDVTSSGAVLHGGGVTQNVWSFPVGVSLGKEITTEKGWKIRPSVDVAVVPSAGDVKARENVSFSGLPGTYNLETEVMDRLSWRGGVGLETVKDNIAMGLNYNLKAGKHNTGHGAFVTFSYKF